jgi:hypothetical protein
MGCKTPLHFIFLTEIYWDQFLQEIWRSDIRKDGNNYCWPKDITAGELHVYIIGSTIFGENEISTCCSSYVFEFDRLHEFGFIQSWWVM